MLAQKADHFGLVHLAAKAVGELRYQRLLGKTYQAGHMSSLRVGVALDSL